ncbi:unnamed protein product [Prorocentrum cordatum]|uniref:CDAN1-interacting nuclease 1 n=1 Tax=Prorocentrum cordatum TaxID=2364126 RepID=A0ABN9WYX8_9DINO|nr:unnamed protein product [Polarella glacialis]
MSLGWLTESSLIPKKDPKPIRGVGSSSLFRLQAAVFERERQGPALTKRRRMELDARKRNEGVEARSAKDEAEVQEESGAPAPGQAFSKRLLEKVKRYEAMAAGRERAGAESLVDFGQKAALCEEESGSAGAAFEEAEEGPPPGRAGAAVPPPACLVLPGAGPSSCSSGAGSGRTPPASGAGSLAPRASPEAPPSAAAAPAGVAAAPGAGPCRAAAAAGGSRWDQLPLGGAAGPSLGTQAPAFTMPPPPPGPPPARAPAAPSPLGAPADAAGQPVCTFPPLPPGLPPDGVQLPSAPTQDASPESQPAQLTSLLESVLAGMVPAEVAQASQGAADRPAAPERASSACAAQRTPMTAPFERSRATAEDLAHQDWLREQTALCRETVGQARQQARGAVRDRLKALRATKLLLSHGWLDGTLVAGTLQDVMGSSGKAEPRDLAVVPAQDLVFVSRCGRELAPALARVPPCRLRAPTGAAPRLSLLLVRWGGKHRLGEGMDPSQEGDGGWGQFGAPPTDWYMDGIVQLGLLRHRVLGAGADGQGPRDCEVASLFLGSSSEVEGLAAAAPGLARQLRGAARACFWMLWPADWETDWASPGSYIGYVERRMLFKAMRTCEAAGLPTAFPHPAVLYEEIMGGGWPPWPRSASRASLRPCSPAGMTSSATSARRRPRR